MMGYGRQIGFEEEGEVADAEFPLRKEMEYLDPGFVRQGLEKLGESGDIEKGGPEHHRVFLATDAELAADILIHCSLLDGSQDNIVND